MGKFSDDEARPHHYLFAHRILPLLALKHGEKMLEMANDGRLTDALERTWDGAGGKVPPEDRLSHEGLETSVHRLQVADLVLVRLPPASHAPEAHFVAITILSTDKAQGSPAIRPTDQVEATGAIPFTNQIHASTEIPLTNQPQPSSGIRYFALELGWEPNDQPRTVLCEWTADRHINMGNGPRVDASAFVAAVAAVLERRQD
jgi:hypothetical protein